MNFSVKHSIGLCAAAIVLLTGCGGGGLELDTVPVTGTVSQGDKPVEGARVTFSPEGAGHAAAGVTDAAGKFTLTTVTSGDGAVPGQYRVAITKYEQRTDTIAPGETDIDAIYAAAEEAGEDLSGMGGRGEDLSGPKNLLPMKYQDAATSGLSASVTADGENDFPFNLDAR